MASLNNNPESGAPYTLSQHSGVGRSSVGRWTVVHTRNDNQGGANISEYRIPPDAEAGFLPSTGHQGRYSVMSLDLSLYELNIQALLVTVIVVGNQKSATVSDCPSIR